MTDPSVAALNTLIFLVIACAVAGMVAAWVIIDTLRACLDVLRLLAAQGSQRRQWVREEHQK